MCGDIVITLEVRLPEDMVRKNHKSFLPPTYELIEYAKPFRSEGKLLYRYVFRERGLWNRSNAS